MVYKAVCVRDCFWDNRRWHRGEMYVGGKKPPRHFDVIDVEQKVFAMSGNPLAKEKPVKKPKLKKKEE